MMLWKCIIFWKKASYNVCCMDLHLPFVLDEEERMCLCGFIFGWWYHSCAVGCDVSCCSTWNRLHILIVFATYLLHNSLFPLLEYNSCFTITCHAPECCDQTHLVVISKLLLFSGWGLHLNITNLHMTIKNISKQNNLWCVKNCCCH